MYILIAFQYTYLCQILSLFLSHIVEFSKSSLFKKSLKYRSMDLEISWKVLCLHLLKYDFKKYTRKELPVSLGIISDLFPFWLFYSESNLLFYQVSAFDIIKFKLRGSPWTLFSKWISTSLFLLVFFPLSWFST